MSSMKPHKGKNPNMIAFTELNELNMMSLSKDTNKLQDDKS